MTRSQAVRPSRRLTLGEWTSAFVMGISIGLGLGALLMVMAFDQMIRGVFR